MSVRRSAYRVACVGDVSQRAVSLRQQPQGTSAAAPTPSSIPRASRSRTTPSASGSGRGRSSIITTPSTPRSRSSSPGATDLVLGDADLALIATWTLSDRELPEGDTLAERYARRPDLPAAERDIAHRIASARLGVFCVASVQPGRWIELARAVNVGWAGVFTLNLPNVLTLLRILLVPVLVVALLDETANGDLLAAIVFALASVTDAIDGYLARRATRSRRSASSWTRSPTSC